MIEDIKEIKKDAKKKDKESFKKYYKLVEDKKVVADFTEYNPLHKGHKYALDKGKEKGLFIAVVPGPLDRSGRGVPYLFSRYIRAEMAVRAGANLVVEGPPMGLLGSGQYMICLIKLFHKLGAEIIPRGYIPEPTMDKVIDCINRGYHILVKPFKIICAETGEILGEKLAIDNYVIASMSQTIYKLRLNYEPKFLFIKRLEGISGTKIREAIFKGKFEEVKDMLPKTTLEILEELKKEGLENYILKRDVERILETANNYDLYKYLPDHVAEVLEKNRPFNSLEEIKRAIPMGFSRHFKERVITRLEARIEKDVIKKYIDNYPAKIKILKSGLDDS
ncbi:nucleotidyltransferase family protein [Methanocaldococcus sp.]